MMGIPMMDSEQLLAFTFVFLRISSLLIMIPIIGERTVPLRVKGGLAILISLLVSPAVSRDMTNLPVDEEIFTLAIAMIGEIMIGVVIGLITKIIFAGIQFAGEMIGIQIGFSVVNVIDPVSSAQVSVIAEFQYLIALLVYLAIDAHHTLIFAIVDSYRIVSPFSYHFSGSLMNHILILSKELFLMAIKISAPIMAVMLFTNLALGVVARTVPQINVFIVGFPLQIMVGLIVFGLTAPVFVLLVQRALSSINIKIYTLLRLM
jgi:flagellar biosynthetic protein FliR